MGLFHLGRICDVAEIDRTERLGTGRALAATASIRRIVMLRTVATFGAIWHPGLSKIGHAIARFAHRGGCFRRLATDPHNGFHAVAEPERIKNLVKALPIRGTCAKECAERGTQTGDPQSIRPCNDAQRIACFRQTDQKAVVAQIADKACQTRTDLRSCRSFLNDAELCAHLTPPCRAGGW